MYDTSTGRLLWTFAHVGLGIFWSVVALQQFGDAWNAAKGGADSPQEARDVGVG